mmetsp:Transcript_13905/g.54915  ORF Transcript_13905/g.54915 Transcript_13905/m.54915 type:complete len:220 (-) Transcript_13905:334-993(-)
MPAHCRHNDISTVPIPHLRQRCLRAKDPRGALPPSRGSGHDVGPRQLLGFAAGEQRPPGIRLHLELAIGSIPAPLEAEDQVGSLAVCLAGAKRCDTKVPVSVTGCAQAATLELWEENDSLAEGEGLRVKVEAGTSHGGGPQQALLETHLFPVDGGLSLQKYALAFHCREGEARRALAGRCRRGLEVGQHCTRLPQVVGRHSSISAADVELVLRHPAPAA